MLRLTKSFIKSSRTSNLSVIEIPLRGVQRATIPPPMSSGWENVIVHMRQFAYSYSIFRTDFVRPTIRRLQRQRYKRAETVFYLITNKFVICSFFTNDHVVLNANFKPISFRAN
jgi:hypothetical protein